MNILTLIPARMGSSRFPGKPLATISGQSMIQRIAQTCSNISLEHHSYTSYVATCDLEIHNHILSHGFNSVLTSSTHERCSDRCSEALDILENLHSTTYDIVIMVQGDEPLVDESMLKSSITPLLQDSNIDVVNLISPIRNSSELSSPNSIKVVFDHNLKALYFSRSPIPSSPFSLGTHYKQVCVIPFRRNALKLYNNLQPTSLEVSESVDMLRFIQHGIDIKLVVTKKYTHPVDVPSDIHIVEELLHA